jgi:hypothetical protein
MTVSPQPFEFLGDERFPVIHPTGERRSRVRPVKTGW